VRERPSRSGLLVPLRRSAVSITGHRESHGAILYKYKMACRRFLGLCQLSLCAELNVMFDVDTRLLIFKHN
jgi:hypothetical protein